MTRALRASRTPVTHIDPRIERTRRVVHDATGLAAVGAWKRCYALDKPVPFVLVTFVGAPRTRSARPARASATT